MPTRRLKATNSQSIQIQIDINQLEQTRSGHKRVSPYFSPGRAVVYKSDGRVAVIVRAFNAGIDEMWMIDFGEKEELMVPESSIVPYEDRLCYCGFPLSNKHRDCETCRWYICPRCSRCGCNKSTNRYSYTHY